MKNVRLFAVAAALGMFASTVAAAETTSKTTVKWTGADTIIKVDLGEEVVVPTLTAVATTTTTGEKCANGTDSNNDGYVDGEIFALNPELNAEQGWLYTNAKYWATNSVEKHTAMYYLGLGGGTVTGGRFLAPGSEEIEEEVFVDQLAHAKYVGIDECFEALVKNESVHSVTYDEDGYIKEVVIEYYRAKSTKPASYVKLTVDSTGRKADAEVKEAVVDFYVNGKDITLSDTSGKYFAAHAYTQDIASRTNAYGVKIVDEDGKVLVASTNFNNNVIAGRGYVITVDYSARKGYSLSDATAANNVKMGQPRKVYDKDLRLDKKTVTIGNFPVSAGTKFYLDGDQTVSYTTAIKTSGTTAGTLLTTDSTNCGAKFGTTKYYYATATSTTVDAIVDAEGNPTTVAYLAKGIATATDLLYSTLENDKTYVINDGFGVTHAFTRANASYYRADTTKVIDDKNQVAVAKDQLTYVYVAKTNDADRYGWTAYDYKTTDIYYEVDGNEAATFSAHGISKTNGTADFFYKKDNSAIYSVGTLIKITEDNAKLLFTYEGMGNFYIDNKRIDSFGTELTDPYAEYIKKNINSLAATKGYFGGAEAEYEAYGFTSDYASVKAYNAISKNAAASSDYLLIDGLYFANSNTANEGTQVNNVSYNQLTKLGQPGTIAIVDISDCDSDDTGSQKYAGATVAARFNIESLKDYTLLADYVITLGDDATIATASQEANDDASYTGSIVSGYENKNGIYELVEIPANDTEYYVLLTDKAGLDLSTVWSYSASKEKGTLDLANGETLDCIAVQLEKNGKYYPAFETEEELCKAVYAITGLDKALVGTKDTKNSTFKAWYDAAKADLDNGVSELPEDETLPVTAVQPTHKAEKCTYDSVSEPTTVTFTTDASAVNTKEAGIYEIKYTADVAEDAENRTATVKVVVAPKYVRTWGANGKVATLTSFYVSNPEAKYAHYVYDWANKKVTVTYYNVDGSVANTAVNSL